MTTCQHCHTELSNPRAKNCAACSGLLSESNKNGTYRAVVDALDTAAAEGLTGADVHQAARSAMQAEIARQQQHASDERQAERARKEAKRERDQVNATLRQHGYTWHKETEESMDGFGATAFGDVYGDRSSAWILTAPDGREVSVRQALTEIGK